MKYIKPYNDYIHPKTDPMEKFIRRQNARRRMILGVHLPELLFGPGISTAGSYIGPLKQKRNPITTLLHKENIEILKMMKKPNLP